MRIGLDQTMLFFLICECLLPRRQLSAYLNDMGVVSEKPLFNIMTSRVRQVAPDGADILKMGFATIRETTFEIDQLAVRRTNV